MKVFRAAILTAKEVEFDAVRKHLVDERRIDDTFDGTVYRRAKIRREVGTDSTVEHWEVAIYRTGRGQQPTTYGTQILIQHFRPDIVLYVGVAGGDPSHTELSVGDVVVGKLVRYYERTSQHEEHFTIKEDYHSPNRALINAAEYEADETTWLNRVVGTRPNSQVFVEEIASGEKVQKSSRSALWTAIKTRYPDVIAVETEGNGFHYAVSQSGGRALMVRSISDLLDNKDNDSTEHGSDDDRQGLASDHAAAFAINLIVNLNTKFLEHAQDSTTFRYAVILKISTDNLEGVHRATRLLADAINDPHLTVESLQPANSFILRISTTLHSAAYARAIFHGGFISELLGTGVTELESDIERTGEPIFDDYLSAITAGDAQRILSVESALLDGYPLWRQAALTLERIIILRQRSSTTPQLSEPGEASEMRALIGQIRKIAAEKNIRQKQMARLLGVAPSSMSKILRGIQRPSPHLILELKQLLTRLVGDEETLGALIQRFRKERGFTQEALAQKMGLSRDSLAQWERGRARPSAESVRRLSEALGINSDQIVSLTARKAT